MIIELLLSIEALFIGLSVFISRNIKYIIFIISEKDDMQKFKWYSILYFILFIISIALYYNRPEYYIRPYTYFVILSSLYAVLFIEITYLHKSNLDYLILFQIILLSLSFIITQALTYPTVLSYDPWVHKYLTETMIRLGQLPAEDFFGDIWPLTSAGPYTKMPGMQTIIAIFSIVTSFDYRTSSFIAIGISSLLINILSAYLIGRYFYSTEVGLISSLLVAIADNVIDMSSRNIVPTSIGIAIVFLIFYIIIKLRKRMSLRLIFTLNILSIFLLFTHTVSYSLLIIQTWMLCLFEILYPKRLNPYTDFLRNYSTYILIIGIAYWSWISVTYFEDVVDMLFTFFVYGLSESGYEAAAIGSSVSLYYIILARFGVIIYFVIASSSILILIIKERNFLHNIYMIICGFVILFGSIAFLAPSLSGIAHRFWYYGEVLCGVPISAMIILIYNNFRLKPMFKRYGFFILFFLLSFLMITSPIANNDNPLLKYNDLRTGLKYSEISAIKFISNDYDGPSVTSDLYYITRSAFLGLEINKIGYLKNFDGILTSNHIAIIRERELTERCLRLNERWTNKIIHFDKIQEELIIKNLSNKKNVFYDSRDIFSIF